MSSLPTHFDVLIIGGGPSGTAAGLTLLKRKDSTVGIIEQSDYSTYRIGESLSPGTRSLLEYLNIWDSFQEEQSLASYGSKAAWGNSDPQLLDYMFTIHGSGWSLDRVRFDLLLANTFTARGGHLYKKTSFLKCVQQEDQTWSIQVRKASGDVAFLSCRYLIDATGRKGLVAKQIGVPRIMNDHLVGVGCVGTLPENVQLESAIQVEACSYGWWYLSPIPGNKVSVVLMSDGDIVNQLKAAQAEEWQNLLVKTSLTSALCKDVQFEGKPKVFPAFSSVLQQIGGKNWVAVGDAAASHDPLSSSGIPHALGGGIHGGILAANVLFGNGQMLSHFQNSIQKDFLQYMRTHWQYYQQENRWSEELFWKRRQTAITLNPYATIGKVESISVRSNNRPTHLPTKFAQKLQAYCQVNKAIHEVARAFANAHPQFSDQRVILALQELIDQETITLNSMEVVV